MRQTQVTQSSFHYTWSQIT